MNSLLFRLFVVLVIAVAASTALSSHAAPLSESDIEAVQRTIATQLAAFAQDDAEGAFETATPAVREAMGTSTRFLALVRGAYPMVYRPSAVKFHKPSQQEARVLQLVEIKDGNAKSWLALFALERQPDASWRISGCSVSENRWLSV